MGDYIRRVIRPCRMRQPRVPRPLDQAAHGPPAKVKPKAPLVHAKPPVNLRPAPVKAMPKPVAPTGPPADFRLAAAAAPAAAGCAPAIADPFLQAQLAALTAQMAGFRDLFASQTALIASLARSRSASVDSRGYGRESHHHGGYGRASSRDGRRPRGRSADRKGKGKGKDTGKGAGYGPYAGPEDHEGKGKDHEGKGKGKDPEGKGGGLGRGGKGKAKGAMRREGSARSDTPGAQGRRTSFQDDGAGGGRGGAPPPKRRAQSPGRRAQSPGRRGRSPLPWRTRQVSHITGSRTAIIQPTVPEGFVEDVADAMPARVDDATGDGEQAAQASFEDVIDECDGHQTASRRKRCGSSGVGGRLVPNARTSMPGFNFDVCGLIRRRILPKEISSHVLNSNWLAAYELLLEHPAALGVTAAVGTGGAGYGLLHTCLARNTPDWFMSYIFNRSSLSICIDAAGVRTGSTALHLACASSWVRVVQELAGVLRLSLRPPLKDVYTVDTAILPLPPDGGVPPPSETGAQPGHLDFSPRPLWGGPAWTPRFFPSPPLGGPSPPRNRCSA